jgi:predicted short-subunit dehydrogenase-like oxidoreductase (DUF2520 family)
MVLRNISFAGAGRVTHSLCKELYRIGHTIDLIVSETEKNGRLLSSSCKALWSEELVFPDSTEIIIVAVPDQQLKNVLKKIKCYPETIVVHTAGSIGIDVFPDRIKHNGVFYPLQTFSKERIVEFHELPFLIESPDEKTISVLKGLAESLGGPVHFVDTNHRRRLHLAAVFASNFTNHMLTLSKELSIMSGFSFDILKPLITETIMKALENGPENSQTGPALRNDKDTFEKHLELLSFSSELQQIYREMTGSIISYYFSKDKRQK